MECETCQGRGFIEKEHGLVMVLCDCDKAREIAEKAGLPWRKGGDIENGDDLRFSNGDDLSNPTTGSTYTGLLFQLAGKRTDEFSIDELWMMAKKEAERKELWPHIVRMPCGNERRFGDYSNLPIEDIPCPCGNPNHYIVRFIDNRETQNGDPKYLIIPEPLPGKTIAEMADIAREIIKSTAREDDNSRSEDNSGLGSGEGSPERTERDNQPTGSPDTGKSKRTRKPKVKKKAGKRSR